MLVQVARPGLEHWVTGDERPTEHPALKDREESRHAAVSVAHHGERLRSGQPPALQQRRGIATFVMPRDGGDRRGVVAPCRLDGERLAAAREEGLARHRVVYEVQHVRGVSPQLGRSRFARLGSQLAPRRPAIAAVAGRVRAPQEARHGIPHRLMHDEAVSARVDEREVQQPA
jgi:hypothetical protein